MGVALITGSAGLVGSESVRFLVDKGFDTIGIDNDLRGGMFGAEASTLPSRAALEHDCGDHYQHYSIDIRDDERLRSVFARFGTALTLVVHTAAQPSHDWAARDPRTDFSVNALGTHNMLEACRLYCPAASFIFTSTNKVYGDRPNDLPLVEEATRFEVDPAHPWHKGIDESMSIDASTHSLFGASKVAADVLVQEYGQYFGMATVCFRGGCLTGPNHAGAMLHGFLAYLMKCVCTGRHYEVFGYQGKQVRDNIHSADLVSAFFAFHQHPRPGEVYNIGGSRFSHCSMREAIARCETIAGRELDWSYSEQNRRGDHIWYVSDTGKFKRHYPEWQQQFDLDRLLNDIYLRNADRWMREVS